MQTKAWSFENGLEVFKISKRDDSEQDRLHQIIEELILLGDKNYGLEDDVELPRASIKDDIQLESIVVEGEDAGELESIAAAIEEASILMQFAEVEEYYRKQEEEEDDKTVIYYYVDHKPELKRTNYYIFTPDWVTIVRAPESELGRGVLGIAYIGSNLVKVLDTLHGDDFKEVLRHELLHIQYPAATEGWIRQRTKQEMLFPTKYQ